MNRENFTKSERLKTMRFKFIAFLIMSLLSINSHCYSAVTSLDNTFVQNDIYSSDFHTRLNRNFTQVLIGGVNSINAANVVDDSIGEAEMADEINPRIRTYEGAGCEFVYTGLLPSTSASLTTSTSSGTAYPRGYRINKASSTPNTYTASKWTYVDIDINGDFQYSEVAIGAAAPSVATNSIRLARVSTDSSTVVSVQDLRTTSCTNGPFTNISSAAGEANLNDVLSNGSTVRRFSPAGRTPVGLARGAFVSYDGFTTFKVTPGVLYINGKYRSVSSDISVTTGNDDPANGISGLDTGSISGSTKYYVYGVADQDSTKSFSVTYSTSTTGPSGVTNYRLIGSINTDATSLFTSRDTVTVHGIFDRELIGAYCVINASATILDSYNVSGTVDNGAGDWTCTVDSDFNNSNYGVVGTCENVADAGEFVTSSVAAGSIRGVCKSNTTSTATDSARVSMIAVGDARR